MYNLGNWTPSDLLEALALVGAAIGFAVGLGQYRRAQQWKRTEWVADEMKALLADPMVQATLLMIDWAERRVRLYPDPSNPALGLVLLTDVDVARALMPHEDRQDGFTDQEAVIRAAFDAFLDGVQLCHSYVEAHLVELTELRPYLQYWAEKICDDRSSTAKRIVQLRQYMPKYGYNGAYRLLSAIAKVPPPRINRLAAS